MTISKLQDIIQKAIKHENKWSLFLHFSKDLYRKIYPEADDASKVGDMLDYLKNVLNEDSNSEVFQKLWADEFIILHFNTEGGFLSILQEYLTAHWWAQRYIPQMESSILIIPK